MTSPQKKPDSLLSVLTLSTERSRGIAFQLAVLLAVATFIVVIIQNTAANLERQGIASGFGFLSSTAGFDIITHLIPYTEQSSYGSAFIVGLLNTLLASAVGIVFATFLGFSVGIARLSQNWMVKTIASTYVELLRNIPLLLQIFVWYFGVLRQLPPPKQSYNLGEWFFLNNRGLYIPDFFAGTLPVLKGFNFQGGITVTPEFVALVVALSTYTAAFIAEIVRSGILSVPKGQIEAAASLGLKRGDILKLIVLPQAMRVIVPPLTSQYLNLTKNSSLAAAIAYPDLVLVFAGTVLMQTGQAVEVVALTMAVYLTISLSISTIMNYYNQRMALRGAA